MPLREDILILLPAILLSLYQVKIVWNRLPEFDPSESEIEGNYDTQEQLKLLYLMILTYGLLIIQLGLPLLTLTFNPNLSLILKIIGYILVLLGFTISLRSLKDLGANWTGMIEYRIKKGQTLTTQGVYKYIRHPIYSSVILELVGFELIANSWLFLIFLLGGIIVFTRHIKREDHLLEQKFGKEYQRYKANTKALLPFIY